MAVLSAALLKEIGQKWMQLISARRELYGLNRADTTATLVAVDAWVDSNSASYNTALPLVARNTLTAKQKAEILLYVVAKRWEVT